MSTKTVNIPVSSSGFGPAVDVSALVGEKTVILSGRYQGAYVLYGSHDGSHFAPLLIFNAGGIESIRQTFSGALQSVALKSLASSASGVAANISGLSVPADNSFTSIGPVGKGISGVVDLGNSAYQTDLNFMGFGRLNGPVVVEGSSDGMSFNPIGEFSATLSGASLLGGGGIEFSPLGTKDKVRYVRLNVLGDVDSFLVTVGGAQSDSGGGGAETLAEAYLVGVTSVDQTLKLSDANGGKVVFDATGSGFMGAEAVDILGPPAFGGLCIGPLNIGIGLPGNPPYYLDPSFQDNVCVGPHISVFAGNSSVMVGDGAISYGFYAVAIGFNAQAGLGSVAIGDGPTAIVATAVAIGDTSLAGAAGTVSVGWGSQANGLDDVAIGTNSITATFIGLSTGSNVAIGAYSSINADSSGGAGGSVVVGTGSSSVGVNNVIIGNGANNSNTYYENDVVVGNASSSLGEGVAIGDTSKAGYYSVAIGANSNADAANSGTGSVAIGASSDVQGEFSVGVGYETFSGSGEFNVLMGYVSGVGGPGETNTCVGSFAIVGNPVGETRSFNNNVRVGSGNALYANRSIGVGNNVVVGSDSDATIIEESIAVGSWATVDGSYAMAFGRGAQSRAYETTFGDNTTGDGDGYVSRLHAISNVGVNNSGSFTSAANSAVNPGAATTLKSPTSLPVALLNRQYVTITGSTDYNGPWYISNVDLVNNTFDIPTPFVADEGGNWSNITSADLFGFDRSLLNGADTTVMTLLIEKHSGGVVAAVPVTLSAPVGGVSFLQVANS